MFLLSYSSPCGLLQPCVLGMGTEACFQAAGRGPRSPCSVGRMSSCPLLHLIVLWCLLFGLRLPFEL